MAGSSIGSSSDKWVSSSLKANNHGGILENYKQSKLLFWMFSTFHVCLCISSSLKEHNYCQEFSLLLNSFWLLSDKAVPKRWEHLWWLRPTCASSVTADLRDRGAFECLLENQGSQAATRPHHPLHKTPVNRRDGNKPRRKPYFLSAMFLFLEATTVGKACV